MARIFSEVVQGQVKINKNMIRNNLKGVLPVWTWSGQTSTSILKIALKNYFTSIPSD